MGIHELKGGIYIKEKFMKKWEKKREKGKFKYLLINGVILEGLKFLSVIFILIIIAFIRTKGMFEFSKLTQPTVIGIILCYPIFGFIFGLIEWTLNEKFYIKELKKRDNDY